MAQLVLNPGACCCISGAYLFAGDNFSQDLELWNSLDLLKVKRHVAFPIYGFNLSFRSMKNQFDVILECA